MERAVFITEVAQEGFLTPEYQRIYFGCEFCERRLPTVPALERILSRAGKSGMGFTLVTPFVTEEGLARVEGLCRYVSDSGSRAEVVVNDWGVLRLIHTRFPSLTPVLGRLLVKQKRCPTLSRVLKRELAAVLRQASEGSDEQELFVQAKLPRGLDAYYQGSNAGSVPVLQKFLSSFGVQRIELDNPLHGVKVSLGNGIRSASVHLPYVYVSTTFYCLSAGCDDGAESLLKRRPCSQQCGRYVFKLAHPSMPQPLYLRGNTHFYRNDAVDEKKLSRMGVDRLVYAPWVPV